MSILSTFRVFLGHNVGLHASFHDALAMRDLLGRRPAPEFEAWLARQGLIDRSARIRPHSMPGGFRALLPA